MRRNPFENLIGVLQKQNNQQTLKCKRPFAAPGLAIFPCQAGKQPDTSLLLLGRRRLRLPESPPAPLPGRGTEAWMPGELRLPREGREAGRGRWGARRRWRRKTFRLGCRTDAAGTSEPGCGARWIWLIKRGIEVISCCLRLLSGPSPPALRSEPRERAGKGREGAARQGPDSSLCSRALPGRSLPRVLLRAEREGAGRCGPAAERRRDGPLPSPALGGLMGPRGLISRSDGAGVRREPPAGPGRAAPCPSRPAGSAPPPPGPAGGKAAPGGGPARAAGRGLLSAPGPARLLGAVSLCPSCSGLRAATPPVGGACGSHRRRRGGQTFARSR